MRVGIVCPYSYTYPGGVGRHAEALTAELSARGHEVHLLAPYDPDDRLARVTHRGASPDRRPVPDHLIPLGRTVGWPINGSLANLALTPEAVSTLGHALRRNDYDVIHVHEANAPLAALYATEAARCPVVGTFHCYNRSRVVNNLAANVIGIRRVYNKLGIRIAVSEAARWSCERFYGGQYRVIPNGVDLGAALPGQMTSEGPIELLFIGRSDNRKGLPVLLRAFEGLRATGIDARLTIAGSGPEDVEPMLLDRKGIHIAGTVSEAEKQRLLGRADILCAPSLGGESFGMVLTEAFAAGTPVVCSDIAGYRDVVRDGVEGVLVPVGDPIALGEALGRLGLDHARRQRMSIAARKRAERFAWPRVASEVLEVYEEAIAAPVPEGRRARASARLGLSPALGGPRIAPARLASIEPPKPPGARRRRGRIARRAAIGAAGVTGATLAAVGVHSIGLEPIARSVVAATPVWVLMAFALMCLSMLVRAEAWNAILRAALPGSRVARSDTARATMIGVLMSATLPARLGEPSRAMIMATRLGKVRDRLPVVLGTIVSQTMLNILALAVLGSVMFATVGIFRGGEDALVIATILPVVLLALVLASPALLRRGKPSRFARVQAAASSARRALVRVRSGLRVFRNPKLGSWAVATQLTAWAVQWLACYVLLMALGLDGKAGVGAAAAVLFAVNVTAALPATPSNLGVFQAACVAVLSAYGIGKADALAYGIILQVVEIATAIALGMPALVREGMSWRDLRLRTLHASPVELPGLGRRSRDPAEAFD